MSDKVVRLPGAEEWNARPTSDMVEDTVKYLEGVIRDMRAGKVTNVAVVTADIEGCTGNKIMLANRLMFAAMLSYMNYRVWEAD